MWKNMMQIYITVDNTCICTLSIQKNTNIIYVYKYIFIHVIVDKKVEP
jgi:hypothetical protein